MTIKIAGPFGGNGGGWFNDLQPITQNFTGINEIKKIKISKIEVKSGWVVDSIKFTYDLETNRGIVSIPGDKHGGDGGDKSTTVNLNDQEWLKAITGKYGPDNEGNVVVKFLEITTNLKPYKCGISYPTDTWFDLLVPSILIGRTGNLVDAIGSLQIEQVKEQFQVQIEVPPKD